jgi:hypothetical protein
MLVEYSGRGQHGPVIGLRIIAAGFREPGASRRADPPDRPAKTD